MRSYATLAAVLVAACSASSSVSTPVISGLTLAASTSPGGMETGTFLITNAAGVSGLSLHLTLTDSTGGSSPVEVEPLAVSGASEQTMANATVAVEIPATGPVGKYWVIITVSDGPDTSDALTGTFEVN